MSSCYDSLKRIEPLTEIQLKGLSQAIHRVRFYPKKFIRMGIHGMGRPSVYETASLFRMAEPTHHELKAFIPQPFLDESVVRYFLRFPTMMGRLDGQSGWMNTSRPMAIAAWSLNHENSIFVSEHIPDSTPFEERIAPGNVIHDGEKAFISTRFRQQFIKPSSSLVTQTAPVRHSFNRGEGFLMGLSLYHEIKESDRARDWFCLGIPPGFAYDF